MIAADGVVYMTPTEAEQRLAWPLDVLAPHIAAGRVFHDGRKVRIIDRFGNELGAPVEAAS